MSVSPLFGTQQKKRRAPSAALTSPRRTARPYSCDTSRHELALSKRHTTIDSLKCTSKHADASRLTLVQRAVQRRDQLPYLLENVSRYWHLYGYLYLAKCRYFGLVSALFKFNASGGQM